MSITPAANISALLPRLKTPPRAAGSACAFASRMTPPFADALLSTNPGLKIVAAPWLDSPFGGRPTVPAGCRSVLRKPGEPSRLLPAMNQGCPGERQLREPSV
jgi:hypothetical protein